MACQTRAEINWQTVEEYEEEWQNGADFPPLDVFRVDRSGNYVLADGRHRFEAAKRAGKKVILCRIHQGSTRQAFLFGCQANRAHGLRRSNADKRYMVSRFLDDQEWAHWTNLRISDQCGVSHTFVGNMRKELESISGSMAAQAKDTFRTGTDGKSYPATRHERTSSPIKKIQRSGKTCPQKGPVSRRKAFAALTEIRRVLKLLSIYVNHADSLEAIERDISHLQFNPPGK